MTTLGASGSSAPRVAQLRQTSQENIKNGSSLDGKCVTSHCSPVFIRTLLLKIHCIVGIPSAMAQLDKSEGNFELVIQPKLKYYSKYHRLMHHESSKHIISFSSSSISLCQNRYGVNFDNLFNTSEAGASEGKEMGDIFSANCDYGDVYLQNKINSPLNHPSESASSPVPLGCSESKGQRNVIYLQFPTREDLKVIIDIYIGVRQTSSSFFSARWLTPTVEGEMSKSDPLSMFLVSDGEVVRHKIVHRSVGLQIGHLSCTISLPHVQNNLTQLPNSAQLISSAAQRLVRDAQILSLLYPSRSGRVLAQQATQSFFSKHLLQGESELTVYKNLLYQFVPNFYRTRVAELIQAYPPTPHTANWARNANADSLLQRFKGFEEELIRLLCLELGPDKSSVSPRMRCRIFLVSTRLSETDVWQYIRTRWGKQHESDFLDFEPDACMADLERHYHVKELLPTNYNFSKVWYRTDERIYFRDVLRFPHNSLEGRYRTQVLAARAQRIPLTMTPNERPLQPVDPHSRSNMEIEILLDKYKPEFLQIIPSIAEAMNALVSANEPLLGTVFPKTVEKQSGGVDTNDQKTYKAFSVFNSTGACVPYTAFLSHISEFTYISPSVLIAAVIYLDRLCMRYQNLILSRHNIQKLFISALRVASKVVDLRSLSNENFAQACSLPLKDINILEEAMLKLMNFDLFLPGEGFFRYVRLLDPPLRRNVIPSSLNINLPVVVEQSSSAGAQTGATALPDKPQRRKSSHLL